MLKVPKSPLPQREVTGELTSINSYLHVTTPQRASAREARQLQCGANPHIVTAHSALAKSVLVQHVYWIKQQTEAASLFMGTARSLDNVMVAPRHANVISIVPRSSRPPPPFPFQCESKQGCSKLLFCCITTQSHGNYVFRYAVTDGETEASKTIISIIHVIVLYFPRGNKNVSWTVETETLDWHNPFRKMDSTCNSAERRILWRVKFNLFVWTK